MSGEFPHKIGNKRLIMDARTFRRITDGYYDKYPSHQQQNFRHLVLKSSSNIRWSRSTWNKSPSQGSSSQDRSYHSKSPYFSHTSQRDMERDFLLYKSRNSDKYSDNIRSLKLRRSRVDHNPNYNMNSPEKMVARSVKWSNSKSSRDSRVSSQRKVVHTSYQSSSRRTNNLKSNSGRSSIITKIGVWSKHISSSNKIYYYNSKTDISQWDQPREWLKTYSAPQSSQTQYHSDKHTKNSIMKSSSMSNCVNKVSLQVNCTKRPTHHRNISYTNSDGLQIIVSQSQHESMCNLDRLEQVKGTEFNSGPCGTNIDIGSTLRPLSNITQNLIDSSTINSNTGRTMPIPANTETYNTQKNNGNLSQTQAMKLCGGNSISTPEMSFRLSKDVKVAEINNQPYERTNVDVGSTTHPPSNINQNIADSLTTNHFAEQRPLTPANTETNNTQEVKRNPVTSLAEQVVQVKNVTSYKQHGHITYPVFSNFVRDDLTSHVKFWPADILEKQAQQLNKNAQILGNVHCSWVSTELKHIRSHVRLTEVHASLLQHRLLFLQEKIKTLEELKSEHLYMCEEDEEMNG